MSADDTEESVAANMGRIDDAFMHMLEARQIHAEQSGRRDEQEKLRRIQEIIITRIQGETPPEVRLLTQLVSAQNKEEREQLMAGAPELISDELVKVVDMLLEQAENAGQSDLAGKLEEIRPELTAKLMLGSV